jgi:hypothetical protein
MTIVYLWIPYVAEEGLLAYHRPLTMADITLHNIN